MAAALIVPTRGDRPSLWPLLASAGMPSVIVDTTGEVAPVRVMGGQPVRILRDTDEPPNIHRWWNAGIEQAWRAWGAATIIISNDDVAAEPGALLGLALAIENGADLAVVAPAWAPRVTPMSGWCFALDARSLRPDEAFSWWYGDDDLWLRAQRPARVHVAARHLRGLSDFSYSRGGLAPLIERDRRLFAQRYGELPIIDWNDCAEESAVKAGR